MMDGVMLKIECREVGVKLKKRNWEVVEDGRWCGRGQEFWYARRAFLNSYHLSLEENSNGKLKQKLKKLMNEKVRRSFSNRRLGIKAFRLTVTLPSLLLLRFTCFMPWFNNTSDIM
ncbi:putative transmembrane protein [Senna tora]|uniref:Putative transmembrane protein n=1 Tax=Senna tora TaxID=362788 RepID=A0A834SJH7_9FABA|nr:putative transmembrane protein [Senna tora]